MIQKGRKFRKCMERMDCLKRYIHVHVLESGLFLESLNLVFNGEGDGTEMHGMYTLTRNS